MHHGPPVTARQQASRKIVAGHPAGMLRKSGRQHAAWIGVYAVMSGQLVPVACWPGHDLDSWPERIRLPVAFAMAMLAGLEEHGADLGPRVNLMQAASGTAATVPLRIAFPEGKARQPGPETAS